ncbi:Protein Skeletor, isoforms D/E [Dirofilaria immitis]
MMIMPLLFILYSIQILHVIGENNNNKPYYGVPLGALHYSDGSTRAEVYAANEYTIIFHHFTHRPRQLGCTSMIIGPAQTTDRNTVNGGVFLSISQPMVASQPTTKKRFIRQAPFTIFGMRNWPVEFDHLELRKDGKEPILSQQKDPFAGIEIDMKSSENITPKTKDIHIEEIGSPKIIDSSTVSTTNSNPIFASISITQNDDFSSESMNELTPFDTNAINIFDDSEIFVKIRDDVKQSNFTMESNITNADTTTIATNTKEFTSDSIKSTRSESKNFHVDVEFGDGDRVKTAMHVNEISKRLLPVSEENEHDTRNKQEGKVGNKINDAMKIDDSSEKFADDVFSYRGTAYPLKQEKLLAYHKEKTEKPNKFGRKDKGFPVMLGQPKPGKWFKKSLQQPNVEKLIKDSDKSATDDYILSEKVFETDEGEVFVSTQNAAATMTPLYRESTPLYWVIQDPRLKKRRRMELRKKNKHENNLDHKAELRRKVYIDRRFELPLIEDKTVVFSLTNNAKITEYQWIALRDDCAQRTIPLLSLKGIDPPHEEEIGAFLGQSHNVTSHHVQILNCNTIFIPGFIFDQGNDPQGTYFHAGIGHFPDRIEKQVRAYVVGQPHDQPLRNYKGENVMIRLPKTYRTFDIDFISVFNEIEGYSYGHVITPCLLVPPCNDYDAI